MYVCNSYDFVCLYICTNIMIYLYPTFSSQIISYNIISNYDHEFGMNCFRRPWISIGNDKKELGTEIAFQ